MLTAAMHVAPHLPETPLPADTARRFSGLERLYGVGYLQVIAGNLRLMAPQQTAHSR